MSSPREIVRLICDSFPNTPIVVSTGYNSRYAFSVRKPNHYYMTGSMGMASQIGIGIADVTNKKTIVIDGDGSVAMNLSALMSVGKRNNLKLIHFVINNAAYASTGGQTTNVDNVDLSGIARSCGYSSTTKIYTLSDLASLSKRIDDGHFDNSLPLFVECKASNYIVSCTDKRIDVDLALIKETITKHVAEII